MTALTQITLRTIGGDSASLDSYPGTVRLLVNTASKCGLTPQYQGLEALYRKYRDQGLVVLGLPANDFAGQEPGSDDEIASFCSTNYDVTFPMFAKLVATGPDKHPIYAALTIAAPEPANSDQAFRDRLTGFGMTPNAHPELLWNFEKFVVGRDGETVTRFAPSTAPDDPEFVAAIEAALAA